MLNNKLPENPLDFLFSLEKFGIKLGLKNSYLLLDYLGDPQNDFRSIHIAGTNGKGSIASILASILQESGLKVGLYTSPHLINFTERIRINGKEIEEGRLTEYVKLLRSKIIELKSTFFEATTGIAFKYFSDEKVDVAVIETGLGGRLDSTNTIMPVLSIISEIGIDHTEQLGNTLSDIAREKAGIIKQDIACISGVRDRQISDLLKETAEKTNSNFYNVHDLCKDRFIKMDLEKMELEIETDNDNYKICSSLIGKHQISNICSCLIAAEILNKNNAFILKKDKIISGIFNVKKNTGLKGRVELIHKNPAIILDVAHNAGSIEKLIETIDDLNISKFSLVFGIMKDKEFDKIIKLLSEKVQKCYVTCAKTERSLDPAVLEERFRGLDVPVKKFKDSWEAIQTALSESFKDDLVIITGSHYICGETLDYLKKHKIA